MTRRTRMLATAALVGLLAPAGAFAQDPDELMPCRLLFLKSTQVSHGSSTFVCKPPAGGSFSLPSGTASFVLFSANTIPPGNSPSAYHWEFPCRGLGTPPGSTGYECRSGPHWSGFDHRFPVSVLIKGNVVKFRAPLDFPEFVLTTHPYPADADVGFRLTAADGALMPLKNYCGRVAVSAAIKNDYREFKAKDAPGPTACSPSGAFLD